MTIKKNFGFWDESSSGRKVNELWMNQLNAEELKEEIRELRASSELGMLVLGLSCLVLTLVIVCLVVR